MFDIGFWELALIGVVALLVIGPDRLPDVARTAGKWVGRANRFIANVKADIDQEIKDEGLQKILHEQKQLAEKFKREAEEAGENFKQSVDSSVNAIEDEAKKIEQDIAELEKDGEEPSAKEEQSAKATTDPDEYERLAHGTPEERETWEREQREQNAGQSSHNDASDSVATTDNNTAENSTNESATDEEGADKNTAQGKDDNKTKPQSSDEVVPRHEHIP